MYRHLLKSDLAFIQSNSSGRLISRFTNDIILMRGAVSNLLVGGAKYFLTIILLIAIMFNLEPFLSFFVFIVFPLAMYPIQKLGRKMRGVTDQAQEELSNYTERLDETFHSIKVIKSFSGEDMEAERAEKITANILELYKKAAKFDALTSPITEILCGLAIACILWYGGFTVIEGKTTPGALFAFISAFISAYRPFKSLVSLNVHLQEGIAAANRVFNILDNKPLITDSMGAKSVKFKDPEIIFDNILLQFGKKIALQSLSLKLEKGKTYAIVGKSGSGKTSLGNLLVRFYDPTEGKVLIDGHDIKDLIVHDLRSQIALVTQDTILFDSSVASNIAYGRPESTKEEIISASKAADADEFISALPEGYDTVIGTGGSTLSGGQKQRLSIARAFLKDAPILILDEATSSLDPNSEQSILNSLAHLRKNKTTLFITHRLFSITDADQIIVMKHGKIVEQGTHAELMSTQKEYHRLYNKELKENEETV
jgi:subfamily B ATP-binding cassette protein MsbA